MEEIKIKCKKVQDKFDVLTRLCENEAQKLCLQLGRYLTLKKILHDITSFIIPILRFTNYCNMRCFDYINLGTK